MQVATSTLVLSAAWFDWHWALLLVPLVLAGASYYLGRLVQRRGVRWAPSVSFVLGFVLMATAGFGYVFSVLNHASYSQNHVLPLIHLQNLDLVVALLGGYGLITRRYAITRTIAPLGLVLAAAKIINNPGAHIASYEIATAMLVGSVPIFAFAFPHRVSWRQALITTAGELVFFVHLSAINQATGTSLGIMAAHEIAQNPFYAFWQSSILQIGAYIIAFVGLQLLAWLVLAWLARSHHHQDWRWGRFWQAVQADESSDRQQIANYGLFTWYALQVKARTELAPNAEQNRAEVLLAPGGLATTFALALPKWRPVQIVVTWFVRARQSIGNNAPNFLFKN